MDCLVPYLEANGRLDPNIVIHITNQRKIAPYCKKIYTQDFLVRFQFSLLETQSQINFQRKKHRQTWRKFAYDHCFVKNRARPAV